jgi:hypothetical protein
LPEYDLAPDAFMIAPGFDEWGEGAPRLGRDLERWRTDARWSHRTRVGNSS